MCHPIRSLLLGMVVSCGVVAPGWSQRPSTRQVTIPDAPICEECRIILTRTGRIQDSDRPGLLPGFPFGFGSTAQGHILVLLGGSGPLIFNPNGTFLGFLGRQGSGPEEFQRPGRVISLGGDTLLILDSGNRRATLARINGEFLGSHPFNTQGLHTIIRMTDTILLMNAIVAEPERVGFPLHTVSIHGKLLASFGAESANPRFRAGEISWQRRLARGTGNRFWVADRFRYMVDRYGVMDRSPDLRIRRTAEWFREPTLGHQSASATTLGSSFIVGLHQPSDSLLWIVSVVADSNWKRESGLRGSGSPVGRAESADLRYLHDTIVEAIDLRSWRVLARTRVDQYVADITEHGYLITYEETDGGVVLDVFTISLDRLASRSR